MHRDKNSVVYRDENNNNAHRDESKNGLNVDLVELNASRRESRTRDEVDQ